MDCSNNKLSETLIRQINKEVAFINQMFSLTPPRYLKDEIFELLKKVGTLIFYPIKEENFWGIYVFMDEKLYFIIYSCIVLEKQVFAGAHELAHSLDIAKVKVEVLTADLMTEYVNHKEYGTDIERADLIANRFAAELLVGEKVLFKKYDELPKKYDIVAKAVLLSDIFLVPYKTIVKRFLETGLITDQSEINSLLDITDEQIKTVAERYECCRRNYEITEEKRLGGYVNKALMLYEHELSTFEELQNRLELLQKTPEDYGVQDDSFDLYEFLRRASESSEVEDDYDEED